MPMWYCMEKERDELERLVEERARQKVVSPTTSESRLTIRPIICAYEEIERLVLYRDIKISKK